MRRLLRTRRAVVLLAVCLASGGLGIARTAQPSGPTVGSDTVRHGDDRPPAGMPHQILVLGPVTKTTGCQYRQRVLPDPACTPGAILVDARLNSICRAGFARRERPPLSYTEPIKRADMVAYGHQGQRLSLFVLDHLVPLELGGSGYSRANLWIQPLAQGHAKDEVENYLASEACAHRIGLRSAQDAIAHDWLAIWQRMTPSQRQQFSGYGDD
jgi:hypothetical protein